MKPWSWRSVYGREVQPAIGFVRSWTLPFDPRYTHERPGVSSTGLASSPVVMLHGDSGNGRVHSPSTTLPSVYTSARPLPTEIACNEPGVELILYVVINTTTFSTAITLLSASRCGVPFCVRSHCLVMVFKLNSTG